MPRNTSQHDTVSYRREVVANLRLRCLTQRAIAKQMADDGLLNPETGKPFSLGTINSDVEALEHAWQHHAMADTGKRQARIREELDEVRRQAWRNGDLSTVLRALKQESDLIGRQGADLSKTGENRAERIIDQSDRAQVEPDSLAELVQRALSNAGLAESTALIDEYNALKAHIQSFTYRVRALANLPDLPPDVTQDELDIGARDQGDNEDGIANSA